jgi:hypothetical protein
VILNVADALVGLVLVWLALRDIFQSVIVPRAVGRRWRASAYLARGMWAVFPKLAWRRFPSDEDRREEFLGFFAPFSMVALIGVWGLMMIVGYGLMFFALRAQLSPRGVDFWGALYFAGSSFLTIGFGDITGRGGLTRLLSLAAGASGLTTVSVLTAYLFMIFGSFQRRESFVVRVGARAGAPPSGVGLLTIAALGHMRDGLDAVFMRGEEWIAEVMESHLAYPILVYFRSSHDYESWIATLGTLLDAATLLMTSIADQPNGQARILYSVGRHCVHDFGNYFGIEGDLHAIGIERSEFDRAHDRLAESGYRMHDRDAAWTRFSELRATYAGNLNAMARWLQVPPAMWISDRTLMPHHLLDQLPHET